MQTFVKIKIVHRLTCVQLRLIRKEKIRKRLNEPRFLCVSPFYATQLVLLPWLPVTPAHIAQQPHFLSTSCLFSEPLCDIHKNHTSRVTAMWLQMKEMHLLSRTTFFPARTNICLCTFHFYVYLQRHACFNTSSHPCK